MSEATKLPDDDPRIIEWNAWKQTGDFANALHWAQRTVISNCEADDQLKIEHPYTEGSMWGAFAAGFRAAQQRTRQS